ncbi:MAG: hypothetical protein NT159_07060 [Proteobacteria bacterium]|nr:hypothetical protein [Pseudomonadota bacterium]
MRSTPSFRHRVSAAILILSCLTFTAEALGADSYDDSTNQLTIPSVLVNGAAYTNVVITVGSVVSVGGGTPLASFDSYNGSTNQLTIPSVLVNGSTYTNVVITVGSLVSVGGSGADSGAPPFRELVLLAGTLEEGGAGCQDGIGTAARLNSPRGLAFDAQGNLFVADTGNQLLRKITPAGVVSSVADIATLPAPIDAEGHETVYSEPTQVAFDPQGNLYVALNQTVWSRSRAAAAADSNNHSNPYLFGTWAVLRVAPDGSTQVAADPVHQAGGALPAGLSATALVLDAQGNLYSAGETRCVVLKGDTAGQLSLFWNYGAYPDPNGCSLGILGFGVAAMAADPGGRVCFTTTGGEVRCATTNRNSVAIGQTPTPPNSRRGMVFDAAGNLYLSSNNGILKMSPAGAWVTLAGNDRIAGSEDGMGTAASFNDPSGLALDREGNLFVADTGNHTIRKIAPDGRVSTVAGLAPQGKRLIDSVGADARFGADFGMAAGGGGQIYVADSGNKVVRRIAPDGSVSTVAGAMNSYGHADGVGSNAKFYGPYTIAVDTAGNMLASDALYLRTISPSAEVRTLPLDYSDGGFEALATCGDGTWLMVTRDRFTTSATVSTASLPGSGEPQPLGYFVIKRLDQTGKTTIFLDSRGSSDSLLRSVNAQGSAPAGLAGDASGRVVFTLGHAVFDLSRDGGLSLLAGQMTESGSTDGAGALARFASPAGIALDAAGNIYVADTGNHTIRKITRSGDVSTILGRAGQPGISLGAAPGGLLEPRAVAVVPGGLVIASRQAVLLARP